MRSFWNWLFIGLVVFSDATATSAQEAPAKKRLLLLSQGPDGHPATTHEYHAGLRVLKVCLDRIPSVDATIVKADEPWSEGPALLDKADGAVVFLSEGAKWVSNDAARLAAFQRLAQRGGGLACLHWGMGTRDAKNIDAFVQLFGGCHGGPDRKYKVLGAEIEPADNEHPILNGVTSVKLQEEFYYALKFPKPPATITPLIRVSIDGESHPVSWAFDRPDKGRSFGFSGLHFHKNWEQATYRRLVTQGVLWTLQLPIPANGLNVEVTDDDLRLP